MVVQLLLLVSLLGGPPPASALATCELAAGLAPQEHLRACAALFADPDCRHAFESAAASSHPSLYELAEACAPMACPRLASEHRDEPFCHGERGSPATGFVAEGRLLAATLALDQPADAKAAWRALLRAGARVADAERAEQAKKEALEYAMARVRLTIRGDESKVTVAVLSPAGSVSVERAPARPLAKQNCAAIVAEAVGSAPTAPEDVAILLSEKTVLFRDVKCIMAALSDAGISDIRFRTVRP